MLPPPVDPPFTLAADDTPIPSYDAASVSDPPRSPTVTASTRLPSDPAATRHAADVSDNHSVAKLPVRPARPLPLYLLAPYMVIQR